MEKLDLFESLIRYLAIKPLECDKCDLEKLKNAIKDEKKNSITFIGEHGYFENLLDTLAKRVASQNMTDGHMYLYIKGDNCKDRFKRNLLELILNLRQIHIISKPSDWPISDPKIKFSEIEDLFSDNHQRFFIYQSPSYKVALISRHNEKGEIEAALTNDPEAVTFLAQIIGSRIYKG